VETGRAGSKKKPERGRTALRLPQPCMHHHSCFHGQIGRVASLVALWLLVVATPARADVRILASPGGEVGSYIKLFSVLRQSGQRVIVDGPCFSACTLVLSTIPRNRICVTPKAVLGFHAPRWVDGQGRQYAATAETRIFVATYPAPVRAWIERHGGLRSKLILLQGRELASIFPRCS
jgi:ATP-dependent protease ClpP protease subunit